jgi:hypothetical protein
MQLIDNINTLLGNDLKQELKPGSRLKIAAATFSIYAFEALKDELEDVESFQFIFSQPTFTVAKTTDKIQKERKEFHIPKKMRERTLYGGDFEIHLKNQLTQRAIARECADWIRRKGTFKSNQTDAPMPQIGITSSDESESVYQPVNNFNAVELGYQPSNAHYTLINKFSEPEHTKTFLQVFDSLWQDQSKLEDVTDSIVNHIETVYQENAPEKLYFFMLYNIFNEFLEDINEDVLPNDLTGYKDSVIWNKMYSFQQHAATGIINKLETYNGCILADSVGLGKTFTALAVIKYYELRNKSVLVLCPKKLSENWLNYNSNLTTNILSKDRLNYDVLCHTDLQRTSGMSNGMPLNRVNWGNYDLVVIDESHNFRNNDAVKERETRYYKLMNMVIRQGVKTKVLMLSATPVNNKFTDLRNQLALAYEGESDLLAEKLKIGRSIEDIFRHAQQVFNNWSKLPTQERTAEAILNALDFDFFELLDSVTIARSRKHIETFYDMTEIGAFPTRRKPLAFRCQLTDREDVPSFDEIYSRLTELTLSVYAPISYILPSRLRKYEELYDTMVDEGRGKLRQADREKSLQRLMTINLLKRLESSVHSFRITLSNLATLCDRTVEVIHRFQESGGEASVDDFTSSLAGMDEDDDISAESDFSVGGKVKVDLADMDVESWLRDIENDLYLLQALIAEMQKVTPEHDSKLQHLIGHVTHKIANPINEGNRKVLIFTAFADTAQYLYEVIQPKLTNSGVNSGIVTGSDTPKTSIGKGYDFQSILTLFSPISKEKALVLPNTPHEIDVLIATDCISEGQNLQDCDYLINYDIHWNPVRIIQRFGRIDRIGSRNETIQLVNYWPDISLDDYINLKDRVESRMHIVDITATGDDNVLATHSADAAYRRDQLQRLQEEVIDLEDVKTGVNITDLGLNDFRMDLLNYMKEHEDISSLPTGLHAVIPSNPGLDLPPGVIFTLRNRNQGVNVKQLNRLHPYYLVFIGKDGQVIAEHTRVKKILDLVRSSCKGQSAPFAQLCGDFNKETQEGRRMDEYSSLLSSAIDSIIQVKEDGDVDSLFTSERTSAMMDKISGLDDFELVSFLVIR